MHSKNVSLGMDFCKFVNNKQMAFLQIFVSQQLLFLFSKRLITLSNVMDCDSGQTNLWISRKWTLSRENANCKMKSKMAPFSKSTQWQIASMNAISRKLQMFANVFPGILCTIICLHQEAKHLRLSINITCKPLPQYLHSPARLSS